MAQIKVLKLVGGVFTQHSSSADDITAATLTAPTVTASTGVVTPSIDTTGALTIGGTNATTITVGRATQNVAIANTMSVTGALTASGGIALSSSALSGATTITASGAITGGSLLSNSLDRAAAGTLTLGGTATTVAISGAATVSSTLAVTSTSTLTGLVTATGGVTTPANLSTTGTGLIFSNTSVAATTSLSAGTTLSVTGLSTLTGGMTTPGNVTVTGAGALSVSGTITAMSGLYSGFVETTSAGTLSLGTVNPAAIIIGKTGATTTFPGHVAVTGNLNVTGTQTFVGGTTYGPSNVNFGPSAAATSGAGNQKNSILAQLQYSWWNASAAVTANGYALRATPGNQGTGIGDLSFLDSGTTEMMRLTAMYGALRVKEGNGGGFDALATGALYIGAMVATSVVITPASTHTGLATFNGGATVASGQTLTVTGGTVAGGAGVTMTGTFTGGAVNPASISATGAITTTGNFSTTGTGNISSAGTITGAIAITSTGGNITATVGNVGGATLSSSGAATVGSLVTATIDRGSAGALTIGATTATSVAITPATTITGLLTANGNIKSQSIEPITAANGMTIGSTLAGGGALDLGSAAVQTHVQGSFLVDGATTLTGASTHTGLGTFNGGLTMGAGVTMTMGAGGTTLSGTLSSGILNPTTLGVSGNATIGGTLGVTGTTTLGSFNSSQGSVSLLAAPDIHASGYGSIGSSATAVLNIGTSSLYTGAINIGRTGQTTTINGNLTVTGTLTGSGVGTAGSVAVAGFTADTAGVTAGNALYISTASKVLGTIATSIAAASAVGFSDATAASGAALNIVTQGVVTPTLQTSEAAWTPGAAVYLSATEAGKVTATAPSGAGQVILRVGYAKTTTTMLICVGNPIVLA